MLHVLHVLSLVKYICQNYITVVFFQKFIQVKYYLF